MADFLRSAVRVFLKLRCLGVAIDEFEFFGGWKFLSMSIRLDSFECSRFAVVVGGNDTISESSSAIGSSIFSFWFYIASLNFAVTFLKC